ncbi:FtsX-like permease family protein [Glaciecola sp. MH2013]|uniref:ABC transporter permease n=1 Tax=Glaciecola sp. MH2013 TaxID=2785524 RepID=UPI0018A08775|nr:FtsX-like permease family protein [Glaciecola sp. MH2013]MBF7073150.1 FtsX-like permease family protein [Glaciecola sp. MH2013]
MPTVFQLAWRLFKHEAKRGELTIILLAIVLSVASVLSLSLFSERLQGALTDRSAEFIAADRQLRSRTPVDEAWITKASEYELETAFQLSTRSMVFGKDELALSDLRAVDSSYPLKGSVKISEQVFGNPQPTDDKVQPGEVWVDSRMFQLLSIKLGDSVDVGDASFKVTRVLSEIPDAGFSVFNTDPIVFMSAQDLAKTNITGPGSRVSYKYYFTGESSDLDDYYDWLRPQLDREIHRWTSIEDDESAIGRSIARAEQYFLLASLLAIVLAAVSIAVAAQRYSQRHFDPVAIMKTLGAGKKMVQRIYLLQICFITVLGIVLGVITGFLLQQGVVQLLSGTVEVSLNVWHWRPLAIAVFTGVICAVLFSLYPLMQLFSVPPLRVLRRDINTTLSSKALQFATSGIAVFMLMWIYSQNLKISAILFVSGIILVSLLLAVTNLLIVVGRKLGSGSMGAWTLAWARIRRRAMGNSVQLISFAITIMLLLVVLVMRNDMVKQWRDQLPEGTPNYFLSNVTETQRAALESHFASNNVEGDGFYPVARGRFVSINDELIRTEVTKEDEEVPDEGRRGLGREANLTWSTELQMGNKIVEGEWLDSWEEGEPVPLSIEVEIAQRLDISLGDKLSFNIGSEVVSATVTSLREVNWQTMQPNFFFVLHPKAMENFSPTYITSFHLEEARKPEITRLMAPFASVTLFDVDARINQLREIIDQVSMAVEFILILVLIAGALVLIAQVQASMDERLQELAILRTLGAKGWTIRFSVINEFIIIGLVAGLMAAISNEFSLYMLQTQVFQMEASLHLEYWLIAPSVGALTVGVLGAIGCWRLLSLNTGELLRKMV